MELNVLDSMKLPVPAVIFCFREGLRFADANQKFVELLGYSRAELEYLTPEELAKSEKNSEFMLDFQMVQAGEQAITNEFCFIKKDGSPCHLRGTAGKYEVREDASYIICTYMVIQKKDEDSDMEAIPVNAQGAGEIPFDLDLSNWTILVSNHFDDVRPEEGKLGSGDFYIRFEESLTYVHPLDREEYVQALKEAAIKPTTGVLENRLNVAPEGEPASFQWFRLYYRSIANSKGKMVRIVGRSFNVNEDKLDREAARRDYLTHFFTKGEIIKAIENQIIDRPELSYILMVIDIDNFKSINDTFGHTFGDNVIIDNANIIRNTLSGNDLIGRVGGDEFVVLLVSTTLNKAKLKAQELCDALSKDYSGDGVIRHISASIGLAEYGKHGTNYEELFEQADRAMYRVKQSGKSNFQVADKSDKKPIVHSHDNNTKQRISINENEQQFMIFAVNLMTHARNIDGSLNMLLKRIASQFTLEHVILLENVSDQNFLTLTNYHSEKFEFVEHSTYKKIPGVHEIFDTTEIKIYDGDVIGEAEAISDFIKERGIEIDGPFSVAITRYEYLGGRDGYLCFVSENPEYEWTEHLKSMLLELTRIISIFVSLRFRMDESKAELRHVQRRDQLTGLYNFEPFKSKAVAHIENSKDNNVFALEYLDINNFGYINENYGYKVGDSVLKNLAEDLRNQPYFITGCRIYSDFFLLLYVGEDVESLINDINAQHRRFTNMQNYQYPSSGVGISSGLFIMDKDFPDMEAAFENVNLAWKKSKSGLKGEMYVFSPELRELRSKEQQILGEFYESLYRDDFKLFLQPKFVLGTHEVYGAEALVRWRKPTGEILSPASFLGPLERIGYITELDFYMFEELLKCITRWKKQGRKTLVYSTNFSGRHFENGGKDFVNRIKLILSKYPVTPSEIELEITESVLIEEKTIVLECLEKLRALGFRVAIDDFGTGYSSLSILSEIPADVVKMDKSFINIGLSEGRKALLSEFAKLVEVAGKETIFEGIETEAQEEFLMECGYTHGQGFILSRPISIPEFDQLYLTEET